MLSFFAREDILELGSYHGLSTAILAQASRNSPTPKHIYSIDFDPACTKATIDNLKTMGLLRTATVRSADALVAVREYGANHRQFDFIFIDHSHAYMPVYEVCIELGNITATGGFCLFHDFNDIRNRDPNDKDYGVYQAVMDGLDRSRFGFYGIYGCTGLYRLVS